MKNKLMAIVVCVTVVLTGCTNNVTGEEKAPKSRFFTKEFFDGEPHSNSQRFEIIVDRETGVNYLVQEKGYGREGTMAMCVLLDEEGRPVITDISEVNEE